MTQEERRIYLINKLLEKNKQYSGIAIPESEDEQKRLLRSLMNVRMPHPAGNDFLTIQDEYLHTATKEKELPHCPTYRPSRITFICGKAI